MDDEVAPLHRPLLRGRLHQAAFLASLAGLVWLVESAPTPRARAVAWVYGLASALLYLTSSSYHVFATSPKARRIMQRADHSMIFILIAATFVVVKHRSNVTRLLAGTENRIDDGDRPLGAIVVQRAGDVARRGLDVGSRDDVEVVGVAARLEVAVVKDEDPALAQARIEILGELFARLRELGGTLIMSSHLWLSAVTSHCLGHAAAILQTGSPKATTASRARAPAPRRRARRTPAPGSG